MKSASPIKAPSHGGRYYRLTYSNVSDVDPKLFQCRDGMAFDELSAPLTHLGYEYGTAIHLYPDDERKLTDLPPFSPADLLVLTTRPPLHDQTGIRPRKWIRSSKSELEGAIFAECAKYFVFCTRKHVELTKHALSRLRQPEKWEHIELFERCGGDVMHHFQGPVPVKPQARYPYTIAFLLRVNNVTGLGCDFLTSFGMDGYGTLIWNRIVRQQHPQWLAAPGFIMAELVFKRPIPPKPLTPTFADDPNHIEVRMLTC